MPPGRCEDPRGREAGERQPGVLPGGVEAAAGALRQQVRAWMAWEGGQGPVRLGP